MHAGNEVFIHSGGQNKKTQTCSILIPATCEVTHGQRAFADVSKLGFKDRKSVLYYSGGHNIIMRGLGRERGRERVREEM